MTFNQIISTIQTTALSNGFVKSFGVGELWEIDDVQNKLDSLTVWVNPVNSVVNLQTNDRQFNILCMGQVKKDKSNELEILSDTESVLIDLIKSIHLVSDDMEITGSPTMTPFKEDYGDWLAGWAAEITITTGLDNNPCNIPS